MGTAPCYSVGGSVFHLTPVDVFGGYVSVTTSDVFRAFQFPTSDFRFLPAPVPTPLRRLLLVTLVVSLIGTLVELLLLEHFEDIWQWTPIILLAAALATLAWHALDRGAASLNVLRGLMVLCIVGGAVGVLLHYQGNVEFELEMYPDLSGWKLFRDSMMGATPALAPGTMLQIGLVGLAWTFRHPALKPGVGATLPEG
jgi:hypothetical protein